MKNLFKILILSLLVFSCNGNNPVSETTSNEIDVDWILVKSPQMSLPLSLYGFLDNDNIDSNYVGYYFFSTENSNILNLNLNNSSICNSDQIIIHDSIQNIPSGIISFNYNDEQYIFNITDSFYSLPDDSNLSMCYDNGSWSNYNIDSYLVKVDKTLSRIIYNQDLGFITLFGLDSYNYGSLLNVTNPNILVDYR